MKFSKRQIFSGCSPGWTHFPNTGRCYKHFHQPNTWVDARSFCLSLPSNGDLASIPDQATNDFLTTLSTDKSYIGASDAETEGSWKWADGTTWGFENWGPGEPNNHGGSQHFGAINYNGVGLWDDDSEFVPKPFFCQYDLGKCNINKKKLLFVKKIYKNYRSDEIH